jgi:hypothetical protein
MNLCGTVGGKYVRLFDSQEWDRINSEYDVSQYIPGYRIIGSVDFDALCVGPDHRVYTVPFIPMSEDHKAVFANGSADLQAITELYLGIATPDQDVQIHFVKPIAFGGDPGDPKNVTHIPQPAHAKMCTFWNEKYFRMLLEHVRDQ